MINICNEYIKLDTPNTTLLFKIEECSARPGAYNIVPYKFVAILYYGAKIKTHDNYDVFSRAPFLVDRIGGAVDDYVKARMPYSSPGMGTNREVSVIVDNADGTNVNRFQFVSARSFKGGVELADMPHARGGAETLELTLFDARTKLTLKQYYTVFDDCDVIAVCQRLINEGTSSVFIEKLASLQLDLPDEQWEISSFDGAWCAERHRHKTLLRSGSFSIESRNGMSSAHHNPFFIMEGTGVNDGKYAFNLIYSGNHKEQVEISPYGATRVITGINDYLFNYELPAGTRFSTPQAIMVFAKTTDELTYNMHGFTLNHIINPRFASYDRPLLYNHWEGTGIDYDEELLLKLADIAKDVGCELFVMDDGWFGHRVNDRTSLGDWFVNRDKFPNGLRGLSDGIKQRGMKFGIWVEPEMISIESEIYKKHPEFAVAIPGETPVERRNQLMIDMSNPEVVEYLYSSLCAVFDECEPDYVKWDYNRSVIDIYSHCNFKAGEFFHKMMLGTYKLLSMLTARYPDMLIESCSSGGSRYDLGMFFFAPQTWGSDDTNAVMREYVQCGTLTAYPQSSFGAHVTLDMCDNCSRRSSIEDRFNLNAIGAFGYEFDFRKLSPDELDTVRAQIEYYKLHRKLLQYGSYVCIDNVFDGGNYYSYMVVAKDKSEAILVVSEKEYIFNKNPKLYRLKALDENALYSVTQRPQTNVRRKNELSFTAYGDALTSYGIDLGFLSDVTDNKEYGGIKSRMFYLKKI